MSENNDAMRCTMRDIADVIGTVRVIVSQYAGEGGYDEESLKASVQKMGGARHLNQVLGYVYRLLSMLTWLSLGSNGLQAALDQLRDEDTGAAPKA